MRLLTTVALPLTMLAATAAFAADGAVAPLKLGKTAPMQGVKMMNVDGKEISLADAAGKQGTMVIFICNHCPWVKNWQSRIATVGNAAMEKGVGVVAINSNDPAAYEEDAYDVMKTRAGEVGYKFPYVVDATSEVAKAFGASHTPEAFVFDAKGKLVYHGAVDDNARDESAVKSRWLEDAVNSVAAGKKVAVTETKALGCSIKMREKSKAS
jgi:peroxiredoxin